MLASRLVRYDPNRVFPGTVQRIKKSRQYAARGIPLPSWHGWIRRRQYKLRYADWAVGVTMKGGKDFRLGEDVHPKGSHSESGVYIGLRAHDGPDHLRVADGRAANAVVRDALQRALPTLRWLPNEGFWPISAYIPTSSNGTVLSAEEYEAAVAYAYQKGYDAIKDIVWPA